MNGDLRIVEDVPSAFASIVATEFASSGPDEPFRIAASGGSSGRACFAALANEQAIDFSRVELYFADERCVAADSRDSNQYNIADALGPKREQLAGFYPMSCANGPAAYEARLRAAGRLDLVQLGLGPDGHTASLFPSSPALLVDGERLVVTNHDILGDNRFLRLTLTYRGIALAVLAVITVIGARRAGVLSRIVAGEDLPAARVDAERVIWLVDVDAGSMLEQAS